VTPAPEHWLDRLAAPHTRRQGMKAVLAGAALSLPFVRSLPAAKAANPSDCRQGCIWQSKQNYAFNAGQCRTYTEQYLIASPLFFVTSPLLIPIANMVYGGRERRCFDRARVEYKLDESNCFKPFCPGFDPNQPGGPCDGCVSPYSCNPCPDVDIGYICCVYPQGDCHGDCCPSHPGTGC
jgi:hypothetical protein